MHVLSVLQMETFTERVVGLMHPRGSETSDIGDALSFTCQHHCVNMICIPEIPLALVCDLPRTANCFDVEVTRATSSRFLNYWYHMNCL